MHVIYHNWSATKQHPHPQSVAEISHHSVLSGDRIRQCETSSGSRHKDTDQCLKVAISFCRHRSVPVPCENGSAETTVAQGGYVYSFRQNTQTCLTPRRTDGRRMDRRTPRDGRPRLSIASRAENVTKTMKR